MAWVMAGAGLVTGGISAVNGIFQKRKANQLIQNNPRAVQDIPNAIKDNQQLAQLYANRGMPSQQYQQQQQSINRSGATAINSAQDRRSGNALIGAIDQNANDANLKLNSADANMQRQNQQNLMKQNNTMGQWQNNVWDWNQRQKYLETAASARALMGAGNANINAGLDRAIGGVTAGLGMKNGMGGFGSGSNPYANLFGRKTSTNNNSGSGVGIYGSGTGADDSAYPS